MKLMLNAPNIYLYREYVDFRKSINGLAAIIESNTVITRKYSKSLLVIYRNCLIFVTHS
ncbi:IS66 family insertion sequence element accessory protein TnpB [Vibrio litoralis]|uniref:IS66 family insertion sequence element accessory protein TnpB n=1 Tax=Vibrio litoralis TaxID=335972 RepID=UPI00186615E8|nr:IS66 family insertion sequence element accessory protein TnpB [Vibrio litoralis]